MLGSPTMALNIEGSRFKSAFGKLEPPSKTIKRKSFAQTSTRRNKKPIGFFDSQKINVAQLSQGGEQNRED